MEESERPIYNVNDKLPLSTFVLTIFQHFFSLAVYMTYPVIIVSAINGSASLTSYLISATLIGCGISTILQYFGKIGSGHLLPMIPNSSYLPASLLAVVAGGLPLLYGMVIISGFIEMLLSRFTRFFRILFPSEVTGVVLFMLGVAIVPFAFPLFFGSTNESPLDPASTVVGIITIGTMIILNMIPKKIFRFYSVIIGICIGFIASVALGVFSIDKLAEITTMPLFEVPNIFEFVSYDFDFALMIPFTIAVICIVLKTLANINMLNGYTNSYKKNNVRRGLFAEGIGISITGAIGGIGTGSSSSGTGLVLGTGIASKKIGIGIGVLLIICGFLPSIGWVFHILPKPILGAVLLYAVVFVMMSGITSISSRLFDQRRIFVVILPILIGVSSAVCPYLYTSLPSGMQLFFASPLTSGAISVLVLGLLFKLGIPKHKKFVLDKNSNILAIMISCGKLWTLDKTQTTSIAHHIASLIDNKTAKSIEVSIYNMSAMMSVEIEFEKTAEKPDSEHHISYPSFISINDNILRAEYILV